MKKGKKLKKTVWKEMNHPHCFCFGLAEVAKRSSEVNFEEIYFDYLTDTEVMCGFAPLYQYR